MKKKLYITLGRNFRDKGGGAHGSSYRIDDFYDNMIESN